ncbi:uncharacterized protein LOC121051185 [Rosa chinensis]|uniref:uncharacterized protein LOC121051185 n=1 Tax=Rosa chinensis TaxID=74649 RepID=UPI001AD8C17B|nr:uncharacterized protein LOC121051185 [Rosa chinensis]
MLVIDDMSFYGVITEIWELDYEKFRIPIFKCDWVENKRGVKVDELGFTLVNLNKKGHLNDTFVLGNCVQPIFYVQDPVDPMWSVVLRISSRDYSDFEVEDELGDTIVAHHPITTMMPSIELPGNLANEEEVGYMREGEEDIVVDG